MLLRAAADVASWRTAFPLSQFILAHSSGALWHRRKLKWTVSQHACGTYTKVILLSLRCANGCWLSPMWIQRCDTAKGLPEVELCLGNACAQGFLFLESIRWRGDGEGSTDQSEFCIFSGLMSGPSNQRPKPRVESGNSGVTFCTRHLTGVLNIFTWEACQVAC